MDFFAPLCSSCGECTWRIERVSAASPAQGSRLVVLVVVNVVFFTLPPSLQYRKERTHVGDWAPVAPHALSFSFSFLFHSIPSSFSPYHLSASTPYHILLSAALCSSPFLPPNSLLDSFISFFRRVSSVPPICQPATTATLIPYFSFSFLPYNLSSPIFSFFYYFFPLFIFYFIPSLNTLLFPSFAARISHHLKTFLYSFAMMKL